MCGRFLLMTSGDELARLFQLDQAPIFSPRYNIAPTQPVAAVRCDADGGGRKLILPRWGLIPAWAADASAGARMINARAETVADKPAYRAALRQRRCLILADGFYEWLTRAGRKQPFCFRLWGDRPFAFAGLWERWRSPRDETIESCTIVTTEANDLVRPVHERMPMILEPRYHEEWLDPRLRESERLLPMLRPYRGEDMHAYPVSPCVGNPRCDDVRCMTALV